MNYRILPKFYQQFVWVPKICVKGISAVPRSIGFTMFSVSIFQGFLLSST